MLEEVIAKTDLDCLKSKICEEMYRPTFSLEGKIQMCDDWEMFVPSSQDMYECYCYWLKFMLLQSLAPGFFKLGIKSLDPKQLAILTSYVSVKLQEEIKRQLEETDLLKRFLSEFLRDENVLKTLGKDFTFKLK